MLFDRNPLYYLAMINLASPDPILPFASIAFMHSLYRRRDFPIET